MPEGQVESMDLPEHHARAYFEQVLMPQIENLKVALENGTDDEVRDAYAEYKKALAEMQFESGLAELSSLELAMMEEAEELAKQAQEMNLD